MEKERKQRSDKKIRVNPSFNLDTHDKIVMLARACNTTKTKMVEEIIEMAMKDIESIENIQNNLGANNEFRVQATKVNDQVMLRYVNFLLDEKKRR
jgi:predicted DNA-binding protein